MATYLSGVATYGVPQQLENKTTNMKTLKYIVLAILLGLNLVSCETSSIRDEIAVDEIENAFFTEDENGEIEDDDG